MGTEMLRCAQHDRGALGMTARTQAKSGQGEVVSPSICGFISRLDKLA
jgi:hypothetical protein